MKKLKQLSLLIWKNFMLQRRRPIGTLVQIGLPLFMSLIYLFLRIFLIKAEHKNAIVWSAYPVRDIPESMAHNFKLGYATSDGQNLSETFIKNVKKYMGQNGTLVFFENEDEMINRLTESDNTGYLGGILFSAIPNNSHDGDFSYAIRLSSNPKTTNVNKFTSANREWVTRFVFPRFQLPQPRNKDNMYGANPSYYNEGFLLIQQAIDRAIFAMFHEEDVDVDINMKKFPFPNYTKDGFIFIIQQFMPNFFVIAFIYSSLSIVRNIVYEKEKRLKETMKMMGVDNWLHWVAWFIQSFAILFISILIMTLMFTIKFNDNGKVINKSDASIVFIFLLLYVVSGIMFCFFLSVFFSKASNGAAGGGILWYVSFIPFFFIVQSYDNMSDSLKTLACVIPNLAMGLGSITLGKFEGTGVGVHWDNLYHAPSVDDQFTMATVFQMMVLDCIIYGVLAWYLEAVFPGQYGAPQRWYFPFTKSYWCGSYTKVVIDENVPLLSSQLESSMDDKFEKDPEGLHVGIDIKNLKKIYSTEIGDKVAVDGVSLKMYQGQITALLGHNGAGKTTLMSVLTGFYAPSTGSAVVNGYDIRTSMDGVRSSLAFCPQHDVLFDTLTVKEHLWFFGRLKGLSKKEIQPEIDQMLDSIKLSDKYNTQTRFLSGGMKRKLSLGLALIGKSKVVMLDEPTSGMDPSARRFTWDLLQKYRPGRTILLTTHFMDEADVLGDRIAIMADGKIQCCGSSLFLKNRYGVGYHIVMVKSPECKVRKITTMIKKYVPNAELESNAGAELSYVLPRESSNKFSELFHLLENEHEELGIVSYGASMTTMEEVFMKVGTECDDTLDVQLKSNYGANGAVNAVEDSFQTSDDRERLLSPIQNTEKKSLIFNTGFTLWLQRWKAMFRKKYIYSRRNKAAIISQLLMPLLFTLFALIAAEVVPKPKDSPPRLLSTSMFDKNTVPYSTEMNASSDVMLLSKMYTHFEDGDTTTEYINNVSYPRYNKGNATQYLLEKAAGKNLGYFNRHVLVAASFRDQNNSVNATAWFNDQAYHAIGASLNAIDNAILRKITGNKNIQIKATNHPLPRTLQEKSDDLNSNGVGLNVAFNLLFGMAFLASSFVVFVVVERNNGAKHLQFVSGVDPISYWTATWLWDLINFVLPCVCILILFVSFNVPAYTGSRLGIVFLVFIFYGFAIIPFMYLFSFLFKTSSKAYIRLTLLNICTGLVALLLVYILEFLKYHDTSNTLTWFFLFLPNFSLGQTFTALFTNYHNLNFYNEFLDGCMQRLNITDKDICKQIIDSVVGDDFHFQENYFSLIYPGVGRYLLILPLEGLLFMALVLCIDYGVCRRLVGMLRGGGNVEDPFESMTTEVEEDSDVRAEKQRLHSDSPTEDVLVVKDLTKRFKTPGRPEFAAVNHLCVGVPLGQCFGLLGVNGAGKTTTFKMLTGDVIPSSGTAFVDNLDITTDLNQVRQRTGYCPQFDALIDLMTGREMLTMYAKLRGVRDEDVDPLVDDLMESVLLSQHADKLTKTYSGGNKRKLSAAIALVGEPLVVFLDEPTTGMDPVARRLLWNALCRVRAEGRSLVITSHSMEECEALCTRLAIMVNGTFRCLGSPQELKNKFVQGYTLLVNVPDTHHPSDTNSLKQFVHNTFPSSYLRDEHNGLLNYHLKSTTKTWSAMFAILEDAHSRGVIGTYAITQTTLEQIFLNFARSQRGYEYE